eukprot:s5276_g6.t1
MEEEASSAPEAAGEGLRVSDHPPSANADFSWDGYASYDSLATVAAAYDRMAPLGRVQAIFESQQKDLNAVWDDMRDKVCGSLMPGRPQQAAAGSAVPTSCANSACSSRTPAAEAPATVAQGDLTEAGHMREHACWLWSRLGSSLMTLADRNAWLEDENKRLRQDLEDLSHSIKKAEQALSSSGLAEPKSRAEPRSKGPLGRRDMGMTMNPIRQAVRPRRANLHIVTGLGVSGLVGEAADA